MCILTDLIDTPHSGSTDRLARNSNRGREDSPIAKAKRTKPAEVVDDADKSNLIQQFLWFCLLLR